MATTTTKTKVLGYIRVSTDQQADGGVSLEAQRAKLTAYCTALDLELVAIFEDAATSAKSLQRPELQRALAALAAGDAAGLLVTKLDRLTRSVADLGWLLEPARFGGTWELLSVADSIDTRTAAGRLVLRMLAVVSEWEREAIGERTRDALAHLRQQGVAMGRAPFGFAYDPEPDPDGRRSLVPVRAEQTVLQRAARRRRAGATWNEIAAELNADGLATKRGGAWHGNTIRRIVSRAA